jgi:hypothetical protein
LGTVAYIATDRFIEDLEHLAREDPDLAVERAGLAIRAVGLTLGGLLAGSAVWLTHLSLRIRRAERFPPPGVRLIREAKILTGERARARARLGFILAAIIAAAAIALPAYLWHVTSLLTRP